MEETHNFHKRSIKKVLTSTPHIVTQEEPGRGFEHIIKKSFREQASMKFLFLQNTFRNGHNKQRKM